MSMVSISLHGAEKGEGVHEATSTTAMHPQIVTSEQGLMGVECNHTSINPLRASNVAKPRTREANTSIKHRSKQASIDMQMGRSKPFDMGQGVRTMTKTIGSKSCPNQ